MAEPKEVTTRHWASPMLKQPDDLLLFHIAGIFNYGETILYSFGEVLCFNEIGCVIFNLLPWNPILFAAGGKAWGISGENAQQDKACQLTVMSCNKASDNPLHVC
jgi:hypothetical protein